MKRFWLFSGDRNDCAGGFGDFVASFDSETEATDHANHRKNDWWHVFDSEVQKITVGKEVGVPPELIE